MNSKINIGDKITLDDLIKMKELLLTHICYVHDEAHKNKIQMLNMPEIDVRVSPYLEQGMIILVDKEKFNI